MRGGQLVGLGLIVLALCAPLLGVYPVFLMKLLCYAMFACAFNLLLGYSKMLSFGHAAFFGSAAYVTGWLVTTRGCGPSLGILGGIAVLVVLHLEWLLQDASRIAWCRSRLEAVHVSPPPPSRFDSEVAVGDDRWDDFAAECGIRLLVAEKSDPLARKLVAQGVMGYHYGTTGLTMARAFAVRVDIGDDFQRLITLCVRWAGFPETWVARTRLRGTPKGLRWWRDS